MPESRARQHAAAETRISVRIKPAQKALIARAARLRQTTLTEFVLVQRTASLWSWRALNRRGVPVGL